MKYYIKLIFYCVIGIFYRKDIRIITYSMQRTGRPLFYNIPREGLITELSQQAYNRMIKLDDLGFKDKVNLNRIRFAAQVKSKYIINTFLCDDVLGRKPDKIIINNYNLCYWWLLKLVKPLTDYSLHKQIEEYE